MVFSGTIRENISFFKSDATYEQIMEAAKISCADEFISRLPLKLDTVIGENRQGLSEGQIQRIAIARAVLTGAPIVLLDEATSALDEVTEKKVLLNLKELTDRTFIFVTHKKTLSSLYNTVIHIKDGKVYQKRYSGREKYGDKKGYYDKKRYNDKKGYSDKKGHSDKKKYGFGEKHSNRRNANERF